MQLLNLILIDQTKSSSEFKWGCFTVFASRPFVGFTLDYFQLDFLIRLVRSLHSDAATKFPPAINRCSLQCYWIYSCIISTKILTILHLYTHLCVWGNFCVYFILTSTNTCKEICGCKMSYNAWFFRHKFSIIIHSAYFDVLYLVLIFTAIPCSLIYAYHY